MHRLDRDIEQASALVIDGNATSRSILVSQLRDLGVSQVTQASRLADGRRRLEVRPYDIVVCEQVFAGEEQTGQELLDDLRREQLLPYATVFVMVTGEARYAQVAEAAESALDGYLLKPYAATALADRLRQSRHRKRVLGEIFTAIEADEFEQAAKLCLQRFAARGDYWLYAARIGAELLLRIDRHGEAQALYNAIIEAKAVPWARLGVARAQAESGQITQAQHTLESLLAADPSYADAYDVMGRVQLEQGKLDAALETYRRAAEMTPGSITRLQKQGMLAYYSGLDEEAGQLLDRVTLLGISSKMYDPQALVLLAFVRFRAKDSKGLQRCRDNLAHLLTRTPDCPRRRRQLAVVETLDHLAGKRLAAAVDQVSALAAERLDASLDVEAACNLVGLLATLATQELALDAMDDWVRDIAVRFSTSRSVTDLLDRSASRHPPFAALIAQAHATIMALSEAAMSHVLEGDPAASVQALLDAAEKTINAKLADTAARTLRRYRERIGDAEALETRLKSLQARFAQSWAPPRLGQGPRAAGGLTLRDGSPAAQVLAKEAAAKTGSPEPAAATVA